MTSEEDSEGGMLAQSNVRLEFNATDHTPSNFYQPIETVAQHPLSAVVMICTAASDHHTTNNAWGLCMLCAFYSAVATAVRSPVVC